MSAQSLGGISGIPIFIFKVRVLIFDNYNCFSIFHCDGMINDHKDTVHPPMVEYARLQRRNLTTYDLLNSAVLLSVDNLNRNHLHYDVLMYNTSDAHQPLATLYVEQALAANEQTIRSLYRTRHLNGLWLSMCSACDALLQSRMYSCRNSFSKSKAHAEDARFPARPVSRILKDNDI